MNTTTQNKIPKKITGSDGVARTYWTNPEKSGEASHASTSLSHKSMKRKRSPRLSDQLDEEQINDILDNMDDETRASADADAYRTALNDHMAAKNPAFSKNTDNPDVLFQISKSIHEGGGTIRKDGAIPNYGFCYSPYPERSKAIDIDKIRPADMIRYMKENEDILSQEGNCVGIWHNNGPNGDNKVYFDVSCVTNSAEEARQQCADNDQFSYFDSNRFESVSVNPKATSGGQA